MNLFSINSNQTSIVAMIDKTDSDYQKSVDKRIDESTAKTMHASTASISHDASF